MSAVTHVRPSLIEEGLEQERVSPEALRPFRAANEFLHATIPDDDCDLIAFFCECDDRDCYAPVWLTPVEFRALVALGGAIRSHQHAAV